MTQSYPPATTGGLRGTSGGSRKSSTHVGGPQLTPVKALCGGPQGAPPAPVPLQMSCPVSRHTVSLRYCSQVMLMLVSNGPEGSNDTAKLRELENHWIPVDARFVAACCGSGRSVGQSADASGTITTATKATAAAQRFPFLKKRMVPALRLRDSSLISTLWCMDSPLVGRRWATSWPSVEPDQWPSLYDEIDAKWGRSAVNRYHRQEPMESDGQIGR